MLIASQELILHQVAFTGYEVLTTFHRVEQIKTFSKSVSPHKR